jgi:hypothetical protein
MRSITGPFISGVVGAVVALASGMSGCGNSSSNSQQQGDDGSTGGDTGTGVDSTVETSVPQDSAAETSTGSDGAAEGSATDSAADTSSSDGAEEGSTTDGASDGGVTEGAADSGATDGAEDSTAPNDAATDSSPPSEAGMTDAGDAGCVTLNVYNFLSWCSVSVNGGGFSSAASQTVCITPGSIPLEAKPKNSAFELAPDPWLYISGPGGTDSGEPGAIDGGVSAATVVVGSTPGCVLVCCPFSSNGTGCDPSFGMSFTNWEMNCP